MDVFWIDQKHDTDAANYVVGVDIDHQKELQVGQLGVEVPGHETQPSIDDLL